MIGMHRGSHTIGRAAVAALTMSVALLVAPSAAAAGKPGLGATARGLPVVPDAAQRVRLAARAQAAIGRPAASHVAPAGLTSGGVEFLANLPELATAISIAFIGDTAFVSTVHGVYSVDISDPTNPVLLGALPHFIFENEHMTVDPVRKRLFISRDPRGIAGTTELPYGIVEIIDVSNPRVMTLINPVQLPVGHTSTCVNACDYIWTGGPSASSLQPSDWGGRPIFGTDVRDPNHPVPCPHAIDLGANDGKTDYAHSVDVDALGIAWVSGRAHVRGFWTQGNHLNPITGHVETATACDPIPYAGGGTNEGALPSDIMHNAWHEPGASIDGRAGDVVVATEENTVTDCATSGRLVTYDIGGSHHGEGFVNIAATHFRLKTLDTWTPKDQPGSTGCDSAHWFTERPDQVLAISFYTQGTRFLDVSNSRHVRQVGYYNPQGTDSWAAYWHGGDTVLVADFTRGLDVLRFHGATAGASAPRPAPTRGDPSSADATPRSLPTTTASPAPAAAAITAILLLAGAAAVTLLIARPWARRGGG